MHILSVKYTTDFNSHMRTILTAMYHVNLG